MSEFDNFDNTTDLDSSFTTTTTTTTSSARTSLTLSFNSFNSRSTTTTTPSHRPHRRHDPHWPPILSTSKLSPDGRLHLRHLKLIRHLGTGSIGRVFLCRLRDFPRSNPNAHFALKVVDLHALPPRKLPHALTESKILSSLDHPFLPTLYAQISASHYTCLLIDFCPNGDLHSLLRRQPRARLPLHAVRFYAAEVLVAIEYLHSKGIVYRDLKPENILIREDGHIMLSDFDLCFTSEVTPRIDRYNSRDEFVAEPSAAYSRSCVGTHEYLAPEVVRGEGHGNGVDWWAFGVLVYELMYGTTPFKGGSKEETLRRIVDEEEEVGFPVVGPGKGEMEGRDLIRRLLVKDWRGRLGGRRGAAEVKRHSFFEGVKWPLIRSWRPPEVVKGVVVGRRRKYWWWKGIGFLVRRGKKCGCVSLKHSLSRNSYSRLGE